MDDQTDKPDVVALPPLIQAAFFALGLLADELIRPLAFLPDMLQYVLGPVIIALSGGIAVWTVGLFRRDRTPFDVRKPASVLVTRGPFRYSRNPGYLALAMLHAGGAILIDNIWAMVLLLPAVLVIHHGVILREESHLERKFGDDYRRYKNKVRRWL